MKAWRDRDALKEAETLIRGLTTREACLAALDQLELFPDQDADKLLKDAAALAVRLVEIGIQEAWENTAEDADEVHNQMKIHPLRTLACLIGVHNLQESQVALALVARFQVNIQVDSLSDLGALCRLLDAARAHKAPGLRSLAESFPPFE